MRIIYIIVLTGMLAGSSCKKYLDKKSNQNLSIPDNLDDLELLLNDVYGINKGIAGINAASDEYYLLPNDWNAADEFNRNAYAWDPQTQANDDWNQLYRAVFVANTVLDNVSLLDAEEDAEKWRTVKGSALFIRAFHMYQLSQQFAPEYTANTNSEFGLPVRLNADFNVPVSRSTVKQTYDQLFRDLNEAVELLPESRLHRTQPSKRAAFAMLARLSLITGDYQKAFDHSDAALKRTDVLIDFNQVDETPEFPMPLFNENIEVLFHAQTDIPINAFYWIAKVDSSLYRTFQTGDLRKKLFFIDNGDGTYSFKGNFTGSYYLFSGLATDEMYLIHAEAAVRTGKTEEAVQYLNALLEKRWETGKFVAITETDPVKVLDLVIEERRKELMFRGLRWTDLRRLNREPRFRTSIKRMIEGAESTLAPDDLRYVFLIPQQVININGNKQNPR